MRKARMSHEKVALSLNRNILGCCDTEDFVCWLAGAEKTINYCSCMNNYNYTSANGTTYHVDNGDCIQDDPNIPPWCLVVEQTCSQPPPKKPDGQSWDICRGARSPLDTDEHLHAHRRRARQSEGFDLMILRCWVFAAIYKRWGVGKSRAYASLCTAWWQRHAEALTAVILVVQWSAYCARVAMYFCRGPPSLKRHCICLFLGCEVSVTRGPTGLMMHWFDINRLNEFPGAGWRLL